MNYHVTSVAMDVYSYSTYKDFLKGYIKENRQKGLISQIAGICGCDRTYLSQVLNGKADLTPDHLIRFCESLNLDETESRYLLMVLLRDRSSSPVARKTWAERIDKLKKDGRVLTEKIYANEKPGEIPDDLRTLYYSSWLYTAIHTLTSIEEFQTVDAISTKLNVPGAHVTKVLRDLVEMKVVLKEKDRYVHNGGNIYLQRESPQSYSHHMNWRMRSVERSTQIEDIHYTNIFSVDVKDVDKLRAQIVKLIDDQRKLVASSGAETACAFACDFFVI